MIKNNDRTTSPRQRLVILAVAGLMLFSTFALYVGIVLSRDSAGPIPQDVSTLTPEEEEKLNKLYAEYMEEVGKQNKELSDKYFESFKVYRDQVKAFNNAEITEIKTKDLKLGDGKEITENDYGYAAYYIGWRTDKDSGEVVFDSSFDDYKEPKSLKAPFPGSPNIVEGWKRGVVGMKIGGVREITVPAAYGYGDNAQGDIPANSNLKFIVMLIPQPKEVKPSPELEDLYAKLMGAGVAE